MISNGEFDQPFIVRLSSRYMYWKGQFEDMIALSYKNMIIHIRGGEETPLV
jgi:hypothetical protein